MILHLNKLESPLPKDAMCQVWLRLSGFGKDENMKDLQTDRKQKTCSQKSSLEFEWLLKLPDRTDT